MTACSTRFALTVAPVVLALVWTSEARPKTDVVQKTAAAPPATTIIAADHTYESPDTVPAGFTTFRLVNRGDEFHGATIVRLESGKTLPQYIDAYAAAQPRGARPAWAKFLGGAYAPPHSESAATLYLEPGSYAWVCFAPGRDNVAHLLTHKQARAFVVRGRADTSRPSKPPAATASLRLLDYSFQFGTPLTPGKHTMRVENVGAEPHHVLMFKLAPGKTIDDYHAWVQRNMQGEPAATFVTAMAELSTGAAGYFEADVPPGDYVLVCLITGRDEVSHAEKGMVQHIRVG